MEKLDVIIAGSGIAGTTMAAVLARHGARVMIIELGKHPRFALGEAMLPQSAIWPFIIGEYFDVHEIQHLSQTDRIVDHITSACGIKRSIGFAYQLSGQHQHSEHLHQLIPPQLPFYSESHLMREDVDAYLLEVAMQHGCQYMEATRITDILIAEDAITVQTTQGEFTAEYYVDASGRGSRLAAQQGYRDGAPEAKTRSRCIFTHVEGLQPYDECIKGSPGQSHRLHDGTLHHVFDGSWLWVIPFDNFERSDSTRASVGLMLDCSRFPWTRAEHQRKNSSRSLRSTLLSRSTSRAPAA